MMPFAAAWMDLEIIILSKSERERQIPYDITYIWNLKYDTDEIMKQKQTHRHREQTCDCQGEGGGGEGELGCLGLTCTHCCI